MTATPAILHSVTCRMCGKLRHAREFVGPHHTGYCWDCWYWHTQALRLLAGGIPAGCQVCRRTFRELAELSPGVDMRMCLHPKDGIYQLLCKPCSDAYERKRRDLYARTPYGHRKKLHVVT